jgi:hypothetical protein
MADLPGQLHVVIPGLLSPPSGLAGPMPSGRALETLLSRADRAPCPGDDPESTLFPLFGIERGPAADWPSAAVCHYGHSMGQDPEGYWLHADPVMLRPDMERLLLFPADALAIEQSEADELLALLNAHFQDQGWLMESVTPDQWLLRVEPDPAIVTRPLRQAAGRSVFPFLPTGDDALRWHGLLNEAQMLMYQAPVNEARRARGRPEINGLWMWGGGGLPGIVPGKWRQVVSSSPLARGLGRLAAASVNDFDGVLPEGEGHRLAYRDDLSGPLLMGDAGQWSDRVQQLLPWFDDLLEGVRRGRWSRLLLYPCNGRCYGVTASDLRRFWRRVRPLGGFAEVTS